MSSPLLPRASPAACSALRFGDAELRPEERLLLLRGEPAPLGPRAFALLHKLIDCRERSVSKLELLDTVWQGVVVEENNLQVQISALRKLLGPQAIVTIPGRGYRFVEPVEGDREREIQLALQGAPAAPVAAATQPAGNLPAAWPPLYGRDADVDAVAQLVAAQPLVSIVGAGGLGKTRLAQAVAAAARARYADGVWLIELAALADPELVCATVCQALRVSLPKHRRPIEELAAALQPQRLLLVLDNCEHLLDAVAALACRLLRDAPGVHVLTTTQERLKAPGEYVYRLAPLAVPGHRLAPAAAESGALRLFSERVRAADRRFEITPKNIDAVIDICGRLEGNALAIELAAARVPLLGVSGVQQRLGDSLRMLSGHARQVPARHQTLRAALDWSCGLLSADETTVFRRLGVFAGGFSLEAAQALAGDEAIDAWAVIEHLSALVDKSLVIAEQPEAEDSQGRPRYRLLDTTRDYALELLADAGEAPAWKRRHAEVTRRTIEAAVAQRHSPTVLAELGNVRAAFSWALREDGDATTAVALATWPAALMAVGGSVTEALGRLIRVEDVVRTHPLPDRLAAQYWQWLGRLGIDGRLPSSRCIDALRRAEGMFRRLGNRRHVHACLRHMAEAMLESGALDDARHALEAAESMEAAGVPAVDRLRRLRVQALWLAQSGRLRDSLRLAEDALQLAQADRTDRYELVLLDDLARLHLAQNDAAQAAQRYRALAERARSLPHGGLTRCYALSGLTAALMRQDDLDGAHAVATEAVPLLQRSGMLLARADILACLLARCGRFEGAACLLGAADRFRRECESARDAIEQRCRDEALQLVASACGEAGLQPWLQAGAQSSEERLARWVVEG